MYIRRKVIKGHPYYYLVEGRRDGKKVKQRVIRYLGKHLRTLSHASGFAPIVRKDATEVFTRLFHRLGSPSVRFEIPFSESGLNGYMDIPTKAVNFRLPASGLTMGHELGHVIDYTLRERNILTSLSPDFAAFRTELLRLTGYKMAYRTNVSRERLDKLRRWCDNPSISHELQRRLYGEIEHIEGYYRHYADSEVEQFANLVGFNLIEPRKTRQLAPKATRWLQDLLWKHRDIRDALLEAGAFELGTTHEPAVLDEPQETT